MTLPNEEPKYKQQTTKSSGREQEIYKRDKRKEDRNKELKNANGIDSYKEVSNQRKWEKETDKGRRNGGTRSV